MHITVARFSYTREKYLCAVIFFIKYENLLSASAPCQKPERGKKSRKAKTAPLLQDDFDGAVYGARTRYLNLGKVALYQMS